MDTVDAGGHRIAYDRQGEGPPLVLLHGYVGDSRMWRIAQALTVPGVARRVKAPVRILKPKVTQDQLADKYPVVLVADRYNFKLRLYSGGPRSRASRTSSP